MIHIINKSHKNTHKTQDRHSKIIQRKSKITNIYFQFKIVHSYHTKKDTHTMYTRIIHTQMISQN